MALRGNLKDFSLPDVFQLVTFSRKTGVLRIKREDGAEGSVWFRDGDVFFAQSNWHAEPLGERLVRAQRVTEQALDKALKIRGEEGDAGRRLGTILVDEGYITEKVLEDFVSEQIQDTIFDLMRWDEGDFDFEAMPEVVEEDIGLTVSIENVVMEGSRRLEEWTRIKKKIPSMDVVFKMATAPGEGTFEISLKPTEWQLLLLVDSTRSVADLATETGRTDFEVARIVYGLFSAGLLEFATDEEIEHSRAERAEREAKLAEVEQQRRAELEARKAAEVAKAEAQRKAAEEAASQAAAEEAAAKAAAEKAAADAAARKAAAQAAQAAEAEAATAAAEKAAERRTPAEEPSFLGGGMGATAEDEAALEAFMGAVLEKPAPQAPEPEPAQKPAAPHVPSEEPAFMAVEHAETEMPGMAVPSVEDIIPDLAVAVPPTQPEPAETGIPSLEPPQVPAADEAAGILGAEPQPLDLEAAQSQVLGAIPDILLAEGDVESVGVDLAPPADAFEPALQPGMQPVAEPEPFASPEPVAEFAVELPEPEQVAELPQAEAEPSAPAAEGHDFERDLMSLGLGELPQDLLGTEGEAFGFEAPAAKPELTPELEPFELLPVSEPMSSMGEPLAVEPFAELEPTSELEPFAEFEQPTTAEPSATPESAASVEPPGAFAEAEPLDEIAQLQAELSLPADIPGEVVIEPIEEEPDFSALLESLDIDNEPEEVVTPADAGFDEELLRDDSATGGVISTDAFMEDMGGIGMGGSLGDELSALTGAGRPARPQASVNKLPEAGSPVLRRDTRVDKETLLKIIDGIQSL